MVFGLVLAAGMLQSVAWAGSTVDRYYIKRAMEAIQQRDFETGAYFLGQEIQENPTNGYAYAYLAGLCEMMSGYNGAMFIFAKKALPLLPKSEKSLKAGMEALQAEIFMQAGDTTEAMACWDRALTYDPASMKQYSNKASALQSLKDYQSLYELGDAMVNRNKKTAKEGLSYIVLVSGLNGLKRYDEAIEAAEKGLKIKDLNKNQQGFLHYLKGRALMGKEEYSAAIQEAMVTASLNTQKGAGLLVDIADKSDIQPVLDSIEAAFEREPSQRIWPAAASDIYARHNNHVQAIYQLLRSTKVSDDPYAYCVAGEYATHYLGDPVMAEELYRKALEKDSTDARPWGSLADLYHDLGRYEEALSAIDEALRLDPEQKRMHISYSIRGRVYLSMHNYPRALEAYQRALVSENDKDAWSRIAILHRQMGDEVAAQRMMELGLREMQNDTTMDMLLALGDTVRAKEKAPKMVRKETNANQQYNAACMYSRMNMPEEAMAALRKSLECGFRNFHHFAWDDDIDNIRELPEFKALMEEYQAKMKEEQEELKKLLQNGQLKMEN